MTTTPPSMQNANAIPQILADRILDASISNGVMRFLLAADQPVQQSQSSVRLVQVPVLHFMMPLAGFIEYYNALGRIIQHMHEQGIVQSPAGANRENTSRVKDSLNSGAMNPAPTAHQ